MVEVMHRNSNLSKSNKCETQITCMVNVANNPTAKLMYYIDCIATILDLKELTSINLYRNHKDYLNMHNKDKKLILTLATLLNPNFLINKCIFQMPELCSDKHTHQFYEVNDLNGVKASEFVIINGIKYNVNKIMIFKSCWLNYYYKSAISNLYHDLKSVEKSCSIS